MEQPQHNEAAAQQNAQGDNAATAAVTNRRTDDKYAPSFFHGKSSEDASEYVTCPCGPVCKTLGRHVQ